MTTIELARKLAELNQVEEAQRAYLLALQEAEGKDPETELEAASYLFFSKGDYQTAYTTFVSLFHRGLFQGELLDLMTQAFYLPNVEDLKKRYEANCRALSRYPYLFRKDFLPFDRLPLLFFPFDDKGYLPFDPAENRFGDYVNFNDPIIDRYFFKDLENPILTRDVYSQYQLEYLNDSVRKSEWVARENHIYLHYTDWGTFCAHLQCLDFRRLLNEEKFVFLMEEEISQYPIDFKERFGIDYSQNPVRPIGIREVNRMIWHTQLSSHNGGDFFNEIFYGHPNLLALESVMLDQASQEVEALRKKWKAKNMENHRVYRELSHMKHPTDKDFLVALFLRNPYSYDSLDKTARIAPIVFFQPHFHMVSYQIHTDLKTGTTIMHSEQYDQIRTSPLFQGFKYIKTFTPMRRPTTSYAATVRFMMNELFQEDDAVISDILSDRLLNRSFMVNEWDRLYRDSVLVRFEDGKLNPKATFTALADFLDIPYTQSMTYCSGRSGVNPESLPGNVLGFDLSSVYKTYDEYANDTERAFLEYFFRDAYEAYGYDFHYYQGEPIDETWINHAIRHFSILDGFFLKSWDKFCHNIMEKNPTAKEKNEGDVAKQAQEYLEKFMKNRRNIAILLQKGLRFINMQGQPLKMMPLLKLDPALLEQPLYH